MLGMKMVGVRVKPCCFHRGKVPVPSQPWDRREEEVILFVGSNPTLSTMSS